ncbi:hypothetical protein HPB48_017259 [Haemaphysalis longicornis]|uniref:Uncharacterized protein n=1 Tax=Haemaphysalis longicornis TaxID=44386 RepID=A0A9J6GJ10_HAELO|nr:hypothetical protein HPB48_017259 [Haemaphysalis longicornis]
MASTFTSTPDSVNTCPKGFVRAVTRPAKSELHATRDSAARAYEAKKWHEILEKAKQRKVCLGCDFCSPEAISSECFIDFADSAELLFSDTLITRKVSALSTGSTRCWRVSATLADRFWLSNTSDEHVLKALFGFLSIRIHNLASIRNFARKTDGFGNSLFVFDLMPPERCPLCRPNFAEREIGGLLPSTTRSKQLARNDRPLSSKQFPPTARVKTRPEAGEKR